MSMIPDEELRTQRSINLAPMVDFLFLILAVFAILVVTRTALYDSELDLVKGSPSTPTALPESDQIASANILLTINENGQYKWITEFNEFLIADVREVVKEIQKQQQLGLLPQEKEKVKVLLHIDKNAQWHSIAQVIFVVKDAGFSISPVYEPET